MSRAFPAICIGCATLALAACAGSGDHYPSLAVRPAERVGGTFAVTNPVPDPTPLDQPALSRIDTWLASARAIHARFVDRAASARPQVAAGRGSNPDDNRWALAQVALADLESIRSENAVMLGDIDLLFVDATLSNTERDQVAHARDAILALIQQEDRVLAELGSGAGR